MYLARVTHSIQATEKNSVYSGRPLFVVKPVCPDGSEMADDCVAVDYVGAGIGNLVLCGSAPGLAREVFLLERVPIRTLIMGIVDSLDYRDI